MLRFNTKGVSFSTAQILMGERPEGTAPNKSNEIDRVCALKVRRAELYRLDSVQRLQHRKARPCARRWHKCQDRRKKLRFRLPECRYWFVTHKLWLRFPDHT